MVNFEELDKEKIAEAERLLRGRANTLGKDRPVSNESFARTDHVPLDAVMTRTPTVENGLVPPDYDDIPSVAALGTRHEEVRLHPYLPSGLTGPASVQSFIAISSRPDSHNFSDIEAVRIKHLISPKYSQGRANAAHPEPHVRGFELALYPAKSNGGIGNALSADTDNPISPVADPSAGSLAPGVGTAGYWYVDYENGIVRFSHPPLNGSNGVMNPNNVYGDIEGIEVSDAYGAITMFATFYQYTGEYGTTENLQFVTVGDGYVSDGVFTGQSHNTVQAAINSLPINGGTVFIKEGTYDFTSKVTIPQNVNVVGLGGVKIIRPTSEAAFAIYDGYVTLEGVEIQPRREGVVISGGAIELGSSQTGEEIKYVNIRNNVLYGQDDAPAIAFASEFDCTYKFLKITNNLFEQGTEPGFGGNIYIGGRALGGFITLNDCEISHNTFSTLNGIGQIDYAIRLTSSFIATSLGIDGLHITDNMMRLLIISIGDISMPEIYNVKISDNTCRSIEIRTDYSEKLVIQSNTVSEHFSQSWIQINCDDFYELRIDNNYVEESILIDPNSGTEVFIYFGTITDNDVENAIEINDTDNGSEIDDMSISGNTTFFINLPRLWATSVASNRSGDINVCTSVVTPDVMRYSSIVDNQLYTGDLVINNSAATGSTSSVTFSSIISGNTGIALQIYGRVTEQVAISSNSFFGSAEFVQVGQAFNDPITISGNQFGSFEVSENIDNAEISSNTLEFTSITGTVSNTNFSNNHLDGSATFTGALSDTTFNSNVNISTFGTLSMPGGLTRCKLADNNYRGTINISTNPGEGDISGTIFSGNTFSTVTIGNTTSGNFLESKFLDGYILTSLAINGIVTNSSVNNNLVLGGALNIAPSSTITRSNIFGNSATSFSFGNLYNSKVESNITSGTATIAPGHVQGSVLARNNFGTTSITGSFTDSKFLDGYCTGSLNITGIIINSDISNNRTTSAATLGSAITNSQINENIVELDLTLGDLYSSQVNENIVAGLANISSGGVVRASSLVGNKFGGATTIDAIMADSRFADGYVGGNFTIVNATYSEISNNIISGFLEVAVQPTSNTLTHVIIDNNILHFHLAFGFNFRSDHVTVSNNNISNGGILAFGIDMSYCNIMGNVTQGGSLQLGGVSDIIGTIISNNIFSTNVTSSTGNLIDCIVENNIFNSAQFTMGITNTNSQITGNTFEGEFACNTLIGCTVTSNRIDSLIGSSLQSTKFESNSVTNGFNLLGEILYSTITDGYFGKDFIVSGINVTNNQATVERSMINNNIITGKISFDTTVAGNAIFLESKFVNNICGESFNAGTIPSAFFPVGRNFVFSDNIVGMFVDGFPVGGTIVLGNNVTFGINDLSLENVWIENNRVISDQTWSLFISGKTLASQINGNYFDTGANFQSMESTKFNHNKVGTDFAHQGNLAGYLQYCDISNNEFGGATVIGDVSLSSTADQTTISNNVFHEMVTFAETSGGCYAIVLSDNFFEDDLFLCADWNRCVISDNVHEGGTWEIGSTSVTGFVTESVISSNASEFGLLSHSQFDEVTFTNNRMTSFEIDIDSTSTASRCADQSVFSGNYIEGTMRFDYNRTGGTLARLNSVTISGNYCLNLIIEDSNTGTPTICDFCNISGNEIDNAFTATTTANATFFTRTAICSNAVFGLFTVDSTHASGGGCFTSCAVVGNRFQSGATLGASFPATLGGFLTTSVFSANNLSSGNLTTGAGGRDTNVISFTNSIISNIICNIMTLRGQMSGCLVNDNHINNSGTALVLNQLNNSMVSDNIIFQGGVTIDLDDGYAALNQSVMTGNRINNDLIITITGTFPTRALSKSQLSGNSILGSLIIDFNSTAANPSVIDSSIISDNSVRDITIDTVGAGFTAQHYAVTYSSISNNTIYDHLEIISAGDGYTCQYSTIDGNIIPGGLEINNTAFGAVCFGVNITDNAIGNEGRNQLGQVVIGGGIPTTLAQVFINSSFDSNKVYGNLSFGRAAARGSIYGSSIDGNSISGVEIDTFLCGSITMSIISDNIVNGQFEPAGFLDKVNISGNIFNVPTGFNMVSVTNIVDCDISNNFVEDWSSSVSNNVNKTIISNNYLGNVSNFGHITSCVISGNRMLNWSNGAQHIDSVISNNMIMNAWNVTYGTNLPLFVQCVISGNVAISPTNSTFTHSTGATGTADFMDSTVFVNNVFTGTTTFNIGNTSAQQHSFRKSIIAFNTFDNLSLRMGGASGTAGTEFDGLVLLGNTGTGTFTYSDSFAQTLTYPTNTAGVDLYMAFNYFATYTSITFTTTIAWTTGQEKLPGAASLNRYGTNLVL